MDHQLYKIFSTILIIIGTLFIGSSQIEVTNLNDSGPGSFRQAIIDANTNAEADTINFLVSGTIDISTAINSSNNLPNITSEVVINGNEVTLTNSIQGRFIQLDAQTTIRDMTFDGGESTFLSGSTAGAIFIKGVVENALFENCTFSNNEASLTGGALRIVGAQVTFNNCDFINNTSGDDVPISCTNGCNTIFLDTVVDVDLTGGSELLINPPFSIGPSQIWTVSIHP